MGNYLRAAPPPEVPRAGHVIGSDAAGSRRQSLSSALDEIDLSTSHRTPRKRKKGQACDVSFEDGVDSKMTTPTRKKLKNTSRYIYETLFQNGQDSDVTIRALGKSWHLHKVYLCQSPYFNSMFSGNWAETNRRDIDINVPDPNVTREALHLAFGSLYRDEVSIRPIEAESLVAAASLLQLDSLIQHCEDVMKENIGPHTVTHFFDAAVTYGIPTLRLDCFSWLLKNLMTSSPEFLAGISPELMTELVDNADLFVMQVEMDVYTLLKKWLFLRLCSDWLRENRPSSAEASSSHADPSSAWAKSLASAAELHLATLIASSSSSTKNEEESLLERDVGKPFARVFRRLRIQHIINDNNSLNILEKERIIPKSWLGPLFPAQWHRLLRLETEVDIGPLDLSTEDFRRSCLRCGRILLQDVDHCWRWTGFHFGVDLLISYQKRQITVKRNTGSHKCPTSVSLHPQRNLMLCVSVVSLEPQTGRILYEKSSAVTGLSLSPDEERVFLSVERHAPFPLHVSVKMLFFTPTAEDLKWYAEQDLDEEGEVEDDDDDDDDDDDEGEEKDGHGEKGENLELDADDGLELRTGEDHSRDRVPSSSSSIRKNLTLAFDGGDESLAGCSAPPSGSRSRSHTRSPQNLKPEDSSSVVLRPP